MKRADTMKEADRTNERKISALKKRRRRKGQCSECKGEGKVKIPYQFRIFRICRKCGGNG